MFTRRIFVPSPMPGTNPTTLHRDDWRWPCRKSASPAGIPLFGICAALQEMNVAFGGCCTPEIRELPGRMNHRMPRLENGEIHPDPTVCSPTDIDVSLVPGGAFANAARLRDHPRQLASRPGHP